MLRGLVLVAWHGHACVELRTSSGMVLVFDPHDGVSLGIKSPSVKADVILVSHDHFDHNATHIVAKEGARVFKMHYGDVTVGDVRIRGFKSYHDKSRGAERGLNTIYMVEVEGFRIAHLGDLGDKPDDSIVREITGVHLLITPVGGRYTIGPSEAWQLVEILKPLNVMPIHYRIPGLRLPIQPVDDFLKLVKGYNIVRLDTNTFRLGEYKNTVIVPRYP